MCSAKRLQCVEKIPVDTTSCMKPCSDLRTIPFNCIHSKLEAYDNLLWGPLLTFYWPVISMRFFLLQRVISFVQDLLLLVYTRDDFVLNAVTIKNIFYRNHNSTILTIGKHNVKVIFLVTHFWKLTVFWHFMHSFKNTKNFKTGGGLSNQQHFFDR